MDVSKGTLGLEDPDVVVENTDETVKKNRKVHFHSYYDEPGVEDEFGPLWGPGSKYKPWIYGE